MREDLFEVLGVGKEAVRLGIADLLALDDRTPQVTVLVDAREHAEGPAGPVGEPHGRR